MRRINRIKYPMRAKYVNSRLDESILLPKTTDTILSDINRGASISDPQRLLNFALANNNYDLAQKAYSIIIADSTLNSWNNKYGYSPYVGTKFLDNIDPSKLSPKLYDMVENVFYKLSSYTTGFIAGVILNSKRLIEKSIVLLNNNPTVDFTKLNQENRQFIKDYFTDYFKKNTVTNNDYILRTKMALSFAIQTKDVELLKLLRANENLPTWAKNIDIDDMTTYVTKSLRPKKGYILYRILQYANNKALKLSDLQRFAYELSYGKGTFDKIDDRGYYSTNFQWAYKNYFTRDENKMWILSQEGKDKLKELRQFFSKNYPKYS